MKKFITLIIIAIVAVMNLDARNVYRPAGTRQEYYKRLMYHRAYLRSLYSTPRNTYRTDTYFPDYTFNSSEVKKTFDYLANKYLRDSIEVNDAIDTIAAANAVVVTIAKIGLKNDTMHSDLAKACQIEKRLRSQKVVHNGVEYVVHEGHVFDCNGDTVNIVKATKEQIFEFLKPEYKPKNQ